MAERTVAAPQNRENQGADISSRQEGTRAQEQYVAPPVDIYETNDGLVVVADLPGVNKDGLSIEVKDDVLTLQGRTQHAIQGRPVYQEFELLSFFRQFQLSDSVDVQQISAELKHGVLTLNLPKAERAKPRKIEVSVG